MDFESWSSKTVKVITGCGNLYITIDYKEDGTVHKVKLQRNSKFACPITVRESLGKQATFQARRDIKQMIKDLKGDKDNSCDKYDITIKNETEKGRLTAFSCSDAVARVLESNMHYSRPENTDKLGWKN